MKSKYKLHVGGRAQAVEITSLNQTKNIMKHVGLDTPFAVAQGYSTTGIIL